MSNSLQHYERVQAFINEGWMAQLVDATLDLHFHPENTVITIIGVARWMIQATPILTADGKVAYWRIEKTDNAQQEAWTLEAWHERLQQQPCAVCDHPREECVPSCRCACHTNFKKEATHAEV